MEGHAIEANAARKLADLGVAYDAFRARRITEHMIEDADLVLTATREHRGAVVTLVQTALPKTFTLREFARLVDDVDEAALPAAPPAERARALVAAAAARRGRHSFTRRDDDVADPYGAGDAAYDRAAREIVEALRRPLHLLQS
jgi:protein-tyrosine phosphatase